MHIVKKLFFLLSFALVSCSHNPDTAALPAPSEFAQPVVKPLKFINIKKLNWGSIKDIPVLPPAVKKIDLDNLPAVSYDSLELKPYTKPFDEAKLDYNALPQKNLDVDKLPSKPLRLKTYMLLPPKLIKVGLPHLKDNYDPSFFELGEAQSLPGQNITCSIKDRQGFIWIANNQGLFRYDGENFFQYLPFDHFITDIMEDSSGKIWISKTNYGLDIIDLRKGTLQITDAESGLKNDFTEKMVQDQLGRIWLTLQTGGVNIIDLKTMSVKSLDVKQGLSGTNTYPLALDANNRVWIGTMTGVNIVDLTNHRIRYMDNTRGLALAIFCASNGEVWFGVHGGRINVLDIHKDSIQTIREAMNPNAIITAIAKDLSGKIWIDEVNRGVEILDPGKHTARFIYMTKGDVKLINNVFVDDHNQVWVSQSSGLNLIKQNRIIIEHIGKEPINDLEEGQDGLIWKATEYDGLDIVNHQNKTIRRLDHRNGLSSDTIIEVKLRDNKIFVTSFDGLDIIDPHNNSITHLGHEQGLEKGIMGPTLIDKKGRYWIGMFRGDLVVYDPHKHSYKHIGKAEGFNGTNIMTMTRDRRGRIWVSTMYDGITVIDPENMTIGYLDNLEGKTEYEILAHDTAGNIWIGNNKGIYIADVIHNQITHFSASNGLIAQAVNSLLPYKGQMYAGTDMGISVIKPPVSGGKEWQVESFGKAYGLTKLNATGNFMTDMITRDGHYWWGGDAGINILDLSKKDTTTPPVYIAGINIMNQPAYFTDKISSDLKTTDTLTRSSDTNDKTSEKLAKKNNDFSYDKIEGPYNVPVNLSLPYNENNIQFNFLSFYPGKHVQSIYRYILVGEDKQWSSSTTETASGNYLGLAPGKYTFKVVTQRLNGTWSNPAQMTFTVIPPWWRTWWADVLYFALFVFLMWVIIYLRSAKLMREKQILEHKVNVRTEEVLQQKEEIEAQRDHLKKAFSDLTATQSQLIQSEKMASLGELTAGIAHEIQNPLNFVNNFSEVNTELIDEMQLEIEKGDLEEVKAIALDIRENEKKINMHGKRADSIVKGMLEHSRSNSGQREPTDLNATADEYLRLSYHGLRAKDKSFNAVMVTHFAPELPKINVIPQDIGRVLLNLFNNAFYAVNQQQKALGTEYKPEVSVTTSAENNHVIIKVKDNGIGIPDPIKEKIMQPFFSTKPTGEGTGLGLSLSYDIVVKGHSGGISVDSAEGEGSEFTVSLPVKSNS